MTPIDLIFETALRTAITGALGGRINGIWHDPPLTAAVPYVRLSDMITAAWSAKGFDGMDIRLTTAVLDGGEDRARAAELSDTMERAVLAMPAIMDGARIVLSTPLRRRTVRQSVKGKTGSWAVLTDWRVLVERTA